MPSMKHPILFDFTTHEGVDLYRTARQVIESLEYARSQIDYSNYDCANIDRAIKMVRLFCKDNDIILGPTKATLEKRYNAKREKESKALREKLADGYEKYAAKLRSKNESNQLQSSEPKE